MDSRTSSCQCCVALVMFLALGLAGCNPVYTIHSIAAPSDAPSTVPDISGLWMQSDAGTTGDVLRVSESRYDVGQCRSANVDSLGSAPYDNVESIADEICFVPVAGHVIVQLRTAGQVQLYQQYLFKSDKESFFLCAAIWSDLEKWSDDHVRGTAAHGLQFTRRGGGDSTQLFVISPRSELLSYLEATLPKVVKACDEVDKEGRSGWVRYVRLTPPLPPDTPGANEEPPSPRN